MTNAERNLVLFSAGILLVISVVQFRKALKPRQAALMMRATATALSAATMAGIHVSWFVDLPGSGTILVGMAALVMILILVSFLINRRTPASV